jgi:UDP-N-acetylmuramate--alanine ligase
LVAMFAREMAPDDVLIMPDPVYYGGTADRSLGSDSIIAAIVARGRKAEHIPDRSQCGDRLVELARPGDRILVMGARDDTLTLFAEDLVEKLGGSAPSQ